MRSLGLLASALALTACVMVKTEGTSGPLAWRVADPAIVPRNIHGQSVETYDFNLVVRNVTDRSVTLTRMERTIYGAGGGAPGRSTEAGRWELKPGAEQKFPLYSYEYCSDSQGCLYRGHNQPLWQILFTGSDDQNRQVESRFDIMLPPRPPLKPAELAPNRRP